MLQKKSLNGKLLDYMIKIEKKSEGKVKYTNMLVDFNFEIIVLF